MELKQETKLNWNKNRTKLN